MITSTARAAPRTARGVRRTLVGCMVLGPFGFGVDVTVASTPRRGTRVVPWSAPVSIDRRPLNAAGDRRPARRTGDMSRGLARVIPSEWRPCGAFEGVVGRANAGGWTRDLHGRERGASHEKLASQRPSQGGVMTATDAIRTVGGAPDATAAEIKGAFYERLWRTAGIQAAAFFVLGYIIHGSISASAHRVTRWSPSTTVTAPGCWSPRSSPGSRSSTSCGSPLRSARP